MQFYLQWIFIYTTGFTYLILFITNYYKSHWMLLEVLFCCTLTAQSQIHSNKIFCALDTFLQAVSSVNIYTHRRSFCFCLVVKDLRNSTSGSSSSSLATNPCNKNTSFIILALIPLNLNRLYVHTQTRTHTPYKLAHHKNVHQQGASRMGM